MSDSVPYIKNRNISLKQGDWSPINWLIDSVFKNMNYNLIIESLLNYSTQDNPQNLYYQQSNNKHYITLDINDDITATWNEGQYKYELKVDYQGNKIITLYKGLLFVEGTLT